MLVKVVAEAIKNVQIGTDKTAAELAIVRLQGELNELAQIQNDLNHRQKELLDQHKYLLCKLEDVNRQRRLGIRTCSAGVFVAFVLGIGFLVVETAGVSLPDPLSPLSGIAVSLLLFLGFSFGLIMSFTKNPILPTIEKGIQLNNTNMLDIKRQIEDINLRIEELDARNSKT